MEDYVKIGKHEGEYCVVCLPAKHQALGRSLPPHTFPDRDTLTAFLHHTLHIPHACIEEALQRGDSIHVSPEQVGRWPL
jgi:hypothetical protein